MDETKIIYLDNAATTKVLPVAAAAAMKAMTETYGNPAAVHGFGKQAKELVEQARSTVMTALCAKKGRVVFTSCGTESSNWAITFGANKNRHMGRHILTTQIEHAATLETVKALRLTGCEVTYIPPERDGSVSTQKIIDGVRSDTALVTVMWVCNETGAVLDIEKIAKGVREKNKNTLLHIDAVQGFMKLPLQAELFDFISISAHKIGGLKGLGGLYIGENIKMTPMLYGGYQDMGLRSGTQPVPQIAAFGAAIDYHSKTAEDITGLRDYLMDALAHMEETAYVVHPPVMAPHIVNVGFSKGRSEVLIRVLSDRGIAVSGGSACSGNKKSHVLTAMRIAPQRLQSSIRISLSAENTKEEIDIFVRELDLALKMFKG